MIKSITFKTDDVFEPKRKTINFGRVNIIIGPKGGGKSTLYDLLANISKRQKFSRVIDALKTHNLEVEQIIADDENLFFNSFKIIKTKNEIEQAYSKRNDIIYQDDPIKKNLSASKKFENRKFKFIQSIVSESEEINQFIIKMTHLYDDIQNIAFKSNSKINWSNSLDIKHKFNSNEYEAITSLDYINNYGPQITQLNKEQSFVNDIIEHTNDSIGFYKRKIAQSKSIFDNSSQLYNDELNIFMNIMIEKLEHMIIFNNKKLLLISKQQKIINSFLKAYQKILNKIKMENEGINKLSLFQKDALNYFKGIAKSLKKTNKSFNTIINTNVEFNIDKKEPADDLLELSLSEVIKLSKDDKFDLVKTILYNPKKIQDDVSNWIFAAIEKGRKEFKTESIYSALARKLKNEVKILADGKDYDTMSLGQRSIYGIQYKFNHSKNQSLFLDQPEDNLDNHTIATKILKLINNRTEQIFIVTHNANIGILSKADKVIVANFEHQEKNMTLDQYQMGIIKNKNNKSDSAFYLEGGIEYIKERLQIIKGD